jgi:hypothetical protein
MAFRRVCTHGPIAAPGAVVAVIVSVMLLGAPLIAKPLFSCSRANTCPVVSLSVQIVDVDANAAPYGLQSDGIGLYTDGQDDVQAVIDSRGVFVFDTGRAYPATRTMIARYTRPLPGYAAASLLVDPYATYQWRQHDVITVPMQELVPGQSMCKGAGVNADDPNEHYATLFHAGEEATSTSPTGLWLITRIDPYTWTIETSATCRGYNVADGDIVNLRRQTAVQTRKGLTYTWGTVGYYHVPFKLILTDRTKP